MALKNFNVNLPIMMTLLPANNTKRLNRHSVKTLQFIVLVLFACLSIQLALSKNSVAQSRKKKELPKYLTTFTAQKVPFTYSTIDYAYDRDSGRLFACHERTNEIVSRLPGAEDEQEKTWRVEGEICSIQWCHLGDQPALAVLTRMPEEVFFLHGTTGAILKRIKLEFSYWAIADTDGSVAESQLPILVLADGHRVRRINLRDGSAGQPVNLDIGHELRRLMMIGNGDRMWSGMANTGWELQWKNADKDSPELVETATLQPKFSKGKTLYLPPPNRLYSGSVKIPLGFFGSYVAEATDPDSSVLCSFGRYSLHFTSRNDGGLVGTFPLPEKWFTGGRKRTKRYNWEDRIPAQLFMDSRRNRVVIGMPNRAALFDMSVVKAPSNNLLSLGVQKLIKAQVGEEISTPLQVSPSDSQVTLVDGPPGLRVEGGNLRWTPNSSHVGTHAIRLRQVHGNDSSEQKLQVQVAHASWMLPIEVDSLHVSPNGRYVLAVGKRTADSNRRAGENPNASLGPYAVVFDQAQSKIIAERTLKTEITGAAVSDTAAFLRIGQFLGKLDITSLKTVSSYKIQSVAGFSTQDIVTVGSVFVDLWTKGPKPEFVGRFDADTLSEVINTDKDERELQHDGRGLLDGSTGFGDVIDGVLYAPTKDDPGKAKLLIRPYVFALEGTRDVGKNDDEFGAFFKEPAENTATQITPRSWHPFAFLDKSNQAKLRDDGQHPFRRVLTGMPVVVHLRSAKDLHTLDITDACGRGKRKLVPIAREYNPQQANFRASQYVRRIACGGSMVAVTIDGRLFVQQVSPFFNEQELPLHILPVQSRFDLDFEQPTRVSYQANRQCQWTCQVLEIANMSIDQPESLKSDSGQFDLDISSHLDSARKQIEQQKKKIARIRYRDRREAWLLALDHQKKLFEKLTRNAPKNQLVRVRVRIMAHNNEFEQFQIDHDYLAELPDSNPAPTADGDSSDDK